MPDVMELSARDRRRMRREVDEFVERRETRERMRRAINMLFWLRKLEVTRAQTKS